MNKSNSSRVKKGSQPNKKPEESIQKPENTGSEAPPKVQKKPAEYPIFKFIQLEASGMNRYQRAYVEERYRGILKSKEEWRKILKPILEVENA